MMWGTKPTETDGVVQDLAAKTTSTQREVFENTYVIKDSLRNLEWRITDETRESIRRDFPGWDLYVLQTEFDAWIADNRAPDDYQAAFYGFVRQHHARHHLV